MQSAVSIAAVLLDDRPEDSAAMRAALADLPAEIEALPSETLRRKLRVLVGLARRGLLLEPAVREGERVADELRRALAEQRDAGALLDRLVESAPLGVAFLDDQLRFCRVNPALAAMNGLAPEDHPGRTLHELLPGLPVEDIERRWRTVLETGVPSVDHPVAGHTPGTHGRMSHWRESAYAVRDGERVLGLAVIVDDVTQEQRSRELHDMLLGIVGHDLRTPLSTLCNALELLGRPDFPEEKRAGTLVRGRRAGQRMTSLIRDLLDFTRVRGGAPLQVQPVPVALVEVLEASVEELRHAHPGRELRVEQGPACVGRWDRERLRQVFDNLLSNAVQHGTSAGPVAIGWHLARERVRISVRNAGNPIPPAALPTLFEPLTRAGRDGRDGDGIGLGLFIARAIVQAHGGMIDVASDTAGTEFSVDLPLDGWRSPGCGEDARQ